MQLLPCSTLQIEDLSHRQKYRRHPRNLQEIIVFCKTNNHAHHLQLSIIIVNYNVKYFLEQCLYSVINACKSIEAEIFVVDNNSSDGSGEYLVSKFPQVKFRWNTDNPGFGKASNSALSEATGERILFLNPDTILPEDCLVKCLDFFRLHQDCGALGVRMIDGSGRFLKESKRSFPSATASFYKIIGLAKIFPTSKTFAAYYAGHLPEDKNNPTDVLSGAFMMLDKRMADATKGFDEDFFMYAEDIDLSFRIQKEGKKNYYFADTTILHFKGESTQKLSADYIKHFYGAMERFVAKHYRNQQMKLFFTVAAIKGNKLFASLVLSIKKLFSKNKGIGSNLATAIIASQPDFDEVIHLVKYAKIPVAITGRITVDITDQENNIGNIAVIRTIVADKKIGQIVFCEAAINNKTAIGLIQQLPATTSFLFHASGSGSIVGSNEKNTRGIFIAKEQAISCKETV